MTFQEIEQKLPNGFHDSKIRMLCTDFVGRTIVVKMDLHAGLTGDPDPERYRPGVLTVSSPSLFFVEPPDPRYRFAFSGKALNSDGDSVKVGQRPAVDRLLPVLPSHICMYRFFLEDWNCFLYLAGESVDFSWDDGESLV